ncbi:MAG: ribonuclease P [Candidatus Woesearchaeota archaeon]|nr:ribonuclease P [Candidatus Woesearchaeota archaeon]
MNSLGADSDKSKVLKKKPYRRKPEESTGLAYERIIGLFKLAEEAFPKNKKLADRYVEIARKISSKYKVRIPSNLKKRFCKHCHSFLVPGKNLRIRSQKSHLVYCCLECRRLMRFPYKNREKIESKLEIQKL